MEDASHSSLIQSLEHRNKLIQRYQDLIFEISQIATVRADNIKNQPEQILTLIDNFGQETRKIIFGTLDK